MSKLKNTVPSKEIAGITRDITFDMIMETRSLIESLIDDNGGSTVNVVRDISYGDDERHRLDVFTSATAPNADRPVLIFVHGGGFVAGDKSSPDSPFYDNIANWAVKNGFNAINTTYRLAPQHQWPSGIEDMSLLIQWVQQHGAEQGLSSDKIILMGQSAGGAHVANYVAHPEVYGGKDHGLAGIVLVSGVYNFNTMRVSDMERAYLGDDTSCYEERSSIEGLMRSDIPMLITTSEYDPHFFEAQGLELLTAIQKQRQKMPKFVHLIGQNHLSALLTLGMDGDLLAPQLKVFIESLE